MKRSAVRTGFLALCFISAAATAAEWSQVTTIASVETVEGMRVLRLGIRTNVASNPGGCDTDPVIDVQLETDGGSSETQRLLLNAIQLAYLTGRNVQFFLREDRCSTVATLSRVRVATGVKVSN